jgi:hypothetical protein
VITLHRFLLTIPALNPDKDYKTPYLLPTWLTTLHIDLNWPIFQVFLLPRLRHLNTTRLCKKIQSSLSDKSTKADLVRSLEQFKRQ